MHAHQWIKLSKSTSFHLDTLILKTLIFDNDIEFLSEWTIRHIEYNLITADYLYQSVEKL